MRVTLLCTQCLYVGICSSTLSLSHVYSWLYHDEYPLFSIVNCLGVQLTCVQMNLLQLINVCVNVCVWTDSGGQPRNGDVLHSTNSLQTLLNQTLLSLALQTTHTHRHTHKESHVQSLCSNYVENRHSIRHVHLQKQIHLDTCIYSVKSLYVYVNTLSIGCGSNKTTRIPS